MILTKFMELKKNDIAYKLLKVSRLSCICRVTRARF